MTMALFSQIRLHDGYLCRVSLKAAWVVVAASFKHFEKQRANDQLATLKRAGIPATILDSNDYPLLTPDLLVVAVGPFRRSRKPMLRSLG
jgi:cell division septation protein DedD